MKNSLTKPNLQVSTHFGCLELRYNLQKLVQILVQLLLQILVERQEVDFFVDATTQKSITTDSWCLILP